MNETYRRMHEERRQQILSTAKRMMLSGSIESVTKVALANELQISRVTLHKYFRSMDEIIIEIADGINESTMKVEHFLLKDGEPLPLEHAIPEFLSYAFAHRDDFVFGIMLDIYLRRKGNDPLYTELYEQKILNADTFPQCIAVLQKNGLVRTDMSAEHLAYIVNYVTLGALNRMIIIGEAPHRYLPLSQEEYIRAITEMLLRYLKACENVSLSQV